MTTENTEKKTSRRKTAEVATTAAAESSPTETTTAVPAPAQKKSISRWLTPVLGGIALLVIGLFGGILIGQHMTGNRGGFPVAANGQNFRFGQGNGGPGSQGQFGQGQPGQGGAGIRGGLTSGTIDSIDGGSLVIKLSDGTTMTVKTDSDTNVITTKKIEVSDLKVGDKVTVTGQKDGDSITANSIIEGQLLGIR